MGHCRFTIMRNNKRATSEKKTPGVAVSGGSSPVTDENLQPSQLVCISASVDRGRVGRCRVGRTLHVYTLCCAVNDTVKTCAYQESDRSTVMCKGQSPVVDIVML